jgi:protease-4
MSSVLWGEGSFMTETKRILSLIFIIIVVSGCAFVNVSLIPPQTPLQEVVLEGKGTPKILLLDISGFISARERSKGLGIQKEPSIVEQLKEALQKAGEDKDISGIIVKINSPGGTVSATDIIYHELTRFREKKGIPVYASIMGIGTSGGYYIASASDKIIIHPTAVTGSIGVIAMKFNVEGLLQKVGVEEETYKSGEKKDIMSPFRPTTPEERKILQTIIDSLHERFVDVVYSQRKGSMSRADLESLADGRIYTSDQALKAKLVDSIGYLDDVIVSMKDSLEIEDARIIAYYRVGEFKGTIYSGYPDNPSPLLNLVGLNTSSFTPFSGVEFLYLWHP